MKEFESFLNKELRKGLRPLASTPRNAEGLIDCYNFDPADGGQVHETVTSLNDSDVDWGEQYSLTPAVTTRDITLVIKDYVSEAEVDSAMVYIDGVLAGTADVNGELQITGIAIGGHTIRITKAGYLDSDADFLLNDYFVVT